MPEASYGAHLRHSSGCRPTLAERFWPHVVKGPECWGWTGATLSRGYGHIRHGGRDLTGSRVSWELHNGPIPAGLQVLHHCDNPPCTNPAHLFLGTRFDNMADAAAKGRHARPSPETIARLQAGREVVRGERAGQARLTALQVQTIRASYRGKHGDLARLSREFGVTPQAIRAIVTRRTWAHVP